MTHTLVVRPSWSLGSNFKATPHTPRDSAQQSVPGHWTVHARVQCNVCIAVSDSALQGRRELKRLLWMYFISKAKYFYLNKLKLPNQTLLHSMGEDVFLISCYEFLYLLQFPEFLKYWPWLLTTFTFSPYCLLAFPSLNDVRTFCAYLNSQMSAWSTAPVSWDVLTVSLTALEFYSFYLGTHTTRE